MWFDMMAIPADAPHADNAHKFLDFIMRGPVMAKASNYVSYANGNKDAQQYMDKEILEDSSIYPSAATMQKLYTIKPYPQDVQRVVTDLWTKVKSG
jgi:putrescine transport system substrate-binding protein